MQDGADYLTAKADSTSSSTPAHPIAVLPVARDAVGAWQVLALSQGIKMGFFDEENKMTGFVLTSEFASERSEMTKNLSA